VRRLRAQVDRFGRAYRRHAEALPPGASPGEAMQSAYRRLKQLQAVVGHVESSAAYLLGSGVRPGGDADDQASVSQQILESLEAERERIYRDVHDGPAQALANAIFEIEYVERVAERSTDQRAARAELRKLKESLRGSLESVRVMIYDLRPPTLSELGLAVAMRTYAADFEARSGLLVDCRLDTSETGLLPQQELAVYRVMQEALQNVHKHAQASAVRLGWAREPARWVLRCEDDGIGFDLVKAARRKRSVGLVSMRERAELIGGSLQVRSTPEQGTAVTLLLPVTKEGRLRAR
jgi:two-component system sensor histidine kinase DegS